MNSVASQNKIALLCPTRKRPELLKQMMDSALSMADSPKSIIFALRLDKDDESDYSFIDRYPCYWHKANRQKGYLDIPSFYNECADIVSQHNAVKVLGIVNDDNIFTKQGWDSIVKDSLPNDIGMVSDSDHTFPFITKRWYDIVGHIANPDEVHVDTYLWDIAVRLGRFVCVEPFLHHVRPQDETQIEAMELANSNETASKFWNEEHTQWRIEVVEKLARYI